MYPDLALAIKPMIYGHARANLPYYTSMLY